VFRVRGICGAETGAGGPALSSKDAVAEAGGVVCPGCVLRVVGDAIATAQGTLAFWLRNLRIRRRYRWRKRIDYFFGPARPILKAVSRAVLGVLKKGGCGRLSEETAGEILEHVCTDLRNLGANVGKERLKCRCVSSPSRLNSRTLECEVVEPGFSLQLTRSTNHCSTVAIRQSWPHHVLPISLPPRPQKQ
jgi:hypothetical protein